MNGESFYEIYIKNKNEIKLNGVLSVDSFDEDFLTLDTELGQLVIEGKNLKIESLAKENREILIKGDFCGLFYKERKIEKGFLSKIFK